MGYVGETMSRWGAYQSGKGGQPATYSRRVSIMLGMSEEYPAFVFSIEGKTYVLKMGLAGYYEVFALGHKPKDRPGAVKIFTSDKDFIEWRDNNIQLNK